MDRKCFVCTGEVQRSPHNSKENALLLCEILEIPYFGSKNEKEFREVSYCSCCCERILNIHYMLEELEKLEKKVLDEKYLIEVQLKANSRNDNSNKLKDEIVTELRSSTIQSMLKKIRKNKVGHRKSKSVRIMQNVNLTIPSTSVLTIEANSLDPIINNRNQSSISQIPLQKSNSELLESPGHESISVQQPSFPIDDGLEHQLNSENGGQDGIKIEPETYWVHEFVDVNYEAEAVTMHAEHLDPSGDPLGGAIPEFENAGIELSNFSLIATDDDTERTEPNLDITVSRSRASKMSMKGRIQNNGTLRPSMRPRKCEECGKVLSTQRTWKQHVMSIHRNEYRFTCDFCSFGCSRRNNMKEHIMRIHTPVKNFKCHSCSGSYGTESDLAKHIKRNHHGVEKS